MQETGVSAAARPRPVAESAPETSDRDAGTLRRSESGPERPGAVGAESGQAEAGEPGPPPIDFGRFYYQHDCGTPYERSPEWLAYFDQLAEHIIDRLAPTRLLDAGCAMGLLVEQLRARGVEAWGIDISEFAIGQVHESVREYCTVGSLADPLPQALPARFDLITCIEVVEHMRPADGEAAIANLASIGDRIFFSSSPTDYAEATHVNVQPPEHWSALFARSGYFRNVEFVGGFPTPWTALYEPASADPAEIVRRYDRKVARVVHELRDVRETALRLQERLGYLEESTAGTAVVERDAALARVQELEAELADSRRVLDSRTGRLLRAWHSARSTLRRPV